MEKNNFNYEQTETQTRVSRNTIKRWEEKFEPEIFSGKSPTEQTLEEVDAEMKRNDMKIIRKYYNIRYQFLDRIIELASKEAKIGALSNVLKNISSEIAVLDCRLTQYSAD